MTKSADEKITVIETEQRLRAVLKGAFAGTPTQLKNIPKTRTKREDGSKAKEARKR